MTPALMCDKCCLSAFHEVSVHLHHGLKRLVASPTSESCENEAQRGEWTCLESHS